MYVNATGANPTGTVMPIHRRKEIYRLACEYNFLIIEDDPYYQLYFTEVKMLFLINQLEIISHRT